LPKKIKTLALKSALSAKIKENNFLVLDAFKLETPKTKEAVKIFSNFKLKSAKGQRQSRLLLLLDKQGDILKRALRNISFLDSDLAKDTHAYAVLAHEKLIITKDGLNQLIERLKK
jgi:large subunit ribosomal protein L4